MSKLPPAPDWNDETFDLEPQAEPVARPRRAPVGGEKSLGRLATSARGSQLRQARWILIVIGILTLLVNLGMMTAMPKLVHENLQKEAQELQAGGAEIDPVALEDLEKSLVRQNYLITGAAAAIGTLFVVFGCLINRAPVPITIASLVIYIGAMAVYGVIDPETLIRGWLIKLFIIVGLFKAVQAAIAIERDRRAELTASV